MSNFKIKLFIATVVICGGLITTGLGSHQVSAQAQPKANAIKPAPLQADDDDKKEEPNKQIDRRHGKIKSIDAEKNELVVTLHEEKFDLPVFLDAKVKVLFGKKTHKLSDFKVGMDVMLSYEGETKNPFEVKAHWPTLETMVKSVDVVKKTVSIRAEGNNGFEFDVPLTVADDVDVLIDALPAGLADLTTEKKVWLEFGIDKKTIEKIEAEASPDELSGLFKAIDDKLVTLTIRVAGHHNERQVDLKFALTDKPILRMSGKNITAKELLENMPVRVKFAANRQTVTHLWAGPVGAIKEDD